MDRQPIPLFNAALAPSQLPRLASLAGYQGPAGEFWPLYLQVVAQAFAARRVLLMLRTPTHPWQAVLQWPMEAPDMPGDAERLLNLSEQALHMSAASSDDAVEPSTLAVLLKASVHGPHTDTVIVICRDEPMTAPLSLWQNLAELAATVPLQFQLGMETREARVEQVGAHRLHDLMRLILRLGQEPHFMQLALALCNDIAVRYRCDRVSLGWIENGYAHLSAVSHIEKFDRKSSASHDLELAMEEALEQETEIHFPLDATAKQVNRAHESYARHHGATHMASIPLRHRDQIVAVLTLERREGLLNEAEAWELGLVARACVRPLVDLYKQDRSVIDSAMDRFSHWRDQLVGPHHSAWKFAGLATVIILTFLVVCPWSYKVDASLTLRSKDLVFIPAPFDGYLRKVYVEAGDRVEKGVLLAELDTRDLVLDESMTVADVSRYSQEAQKAQAARQLADMQISLARQAQSQAKLDLIHQQKETAKIRAPYTGIVVEGDLRKNLGSPLRKGDLMLKMAQLDDNYVELEIDQADVHEVKVGTRGEFALVGQPDQKFTLVIDRMDPAATQRDSRNLYIARARVESAPQGWWRPGMGGTAKLEAGDRSLIWVLTHRTVRFLRQVFWL
jgi:multidrug resistance efflux pump